MPVAEILAQARQNWSRWELEGDPGNSCPRLSEVSVEEGLEVGRKVALVADSERARKVGRSRALRV